MLLIPETLGEACVQIDVRIYVRSCTTNQSQPYARGSCCKGHGRGWVQDEKAAREAAEARVTALETELEEAKALAAKQSKEEIDAMAAERDSLRTEVRSCTVRHEHSGLFPHG